MTGSSGSAEAGPSRTASMAPPVAPPHATGALEENGRKSPGMATAERQEDHLARPPTADAQSFGLPSASTSHVMDDRSAGKRPSTVRSPSPQPDQRHAGFGAQHRDRRASSSKEKLPSALDRRRARDMASALLRLTRCAECEGPLNDPITLPCGHTACLQCIRNRCQPGFSSTRGNDEEPTLPCATHIPPRLPLSPMTVSCPVNGCPRSAIGRGMGKWSGHRPRYGLVPAYQERLPTDSEDVGPGSPPLDGFVIGVADHPHRLTVVGPQCRTKSHLFAVPPVGVETTASGSSAASTSASLLPSLSTSNLLRTDVSLSKAIAILKRYVAAPVPRASRSRRSPPRSPLRPRAGRAGRRRYGSGLGRGVVFERRALAAARGRGLTIPGPSGSGSRGTTGLLPAGRAFQRRSNDQGRGGAMRRTQLLRSAMSVLGTNESELESGTVGGVRAVPESEEDEADEEADDLYGDDGGAYDDDELSDYDSAYDDDGDGDEFEDEDDDGGYHARFRSGLEDEGEEDPGMLWPDGVGGAYARPLASGGSLSARAHRKRRRARTSLRAGDHRGSPESQLDALRHGPVRRLFDDADGPRGDSGWSTEESALTDAITGKFADQATASASRADSRPTSPGPESHRGQGRELADKQRSLALSTKTGPNGEPLVQTVATLHAELLEVLECQLCYLLLYQPLTTPCGHTFCRSCFARSLDHGNRCPLCRADMPNVAFFSEHPCNFALLKMLTADTATLTDSEDSAADATSPFDEDDKRLELHAPTSSSSAAAKFGGLAAPATTAPLRAPSSPLSEGENNPHHLGFKQLYENRKSAIEQEEREARLSTPLFICTLAFPQMPTILHIFEPRYRLMIRRCLESGNPRFGMVLPSRDNGGLGEYGTMLEIKSVQMLTDGRSMLETVGSYRFKVLEKGTLDGYTVGRIERVEDIPLEEEAELERQAMVRRRALEHCADANRTSRPPSRGATEAQATAPSAGASVEEQPLAQSPAAGSQRPPSSQGRDGAGDGEDASMSLFRREGSEAVQATTETAAMHRAPSSAGGRREGSEYGFTDDSSDGGMPPFLPIPQEPTTAELVEICRSFIATLRSGSAPWLLTRLHNAYGPMPEAHEVERLGYWMALVMPIDEHEKAKLLPITSRRLRLCMVVDWIEQLRQSWWFSNGCTVS
ncbi:uncharacterized protein PFL1_02882 [Pseudozyma flocculosa PF-1]|uniref:RING-type domain-containing protein n=2 Tax=Pseudozyma flocculosa TaxID=84751 RepID=A0A5C3F2C6_9BASI|nr:uncharacterized protein PFL1_02882 [Pseudozyma flocculosa PF-1]EPQ29662.1 hypothetical protein PFL1_02882 [Pseudozyma flocculosa PF-1]SPO38230.1 uncharacterized protein PSFLO_03707 [Pseudozyma flocculosa]